jgi:CHAT domain-containing protein/tetratricopeptide (TPR) repeat protein
VIGLLVLVPSSALPTEPSEGAEAWLEEARAAWREGRVEDGAAALERAEALIPDLETLPGSDLFEGRGVIALAAGDLDGALAWTRRALDLRLRLDPGSYGVVMAWHNLRVVYAQQGDTAEAAASAREVIALRGAVAAPEERVGVCAEAARSLHEVGATAEARAALAPEVLRAQGALGADDPSLIRGRATLALLHLALGELDDAEHHLRLVVAGRDGLPVEDARRGGAANNLGLVLQERGDLIAARAWFERALADWTAGLGPDHPHVATALTNLGTVSVDLGDVDAGAALHERALTIRRATLPAGHREIGTSLANLAIVAAHRGAWSETIALLEEALGSLDPEQQHTVRIEADLVAALTQDGQLDRAEQHLAHARAVMQRTVGDTHPFFVELDLLEARLRVARGDPGGAADLAQRAVERARAASGPDHPTVANAAMRRARIDPTVAAASIDEALRILERRLDQIEHLSDREAILLRRDGAATMAEWFATHEGGTDSLEAWAHATAWKGAAARRAVARGGPSFDALAVARRALADAAWSTEGTEAERDATLTRLTQERDALERSWTQAEPLAPPAAVCAALGRHEVLVDLLALPDTYQAFVVDRRCRPQVVPLPRADVDAAIRHLLQLAADPTTTPTRRNTAADQVRRMLWDPLAPLLGSRDVIVSPDGSGSLVPWGALPVDPEASSYLIERRVFYTVDRPSDLLRPSPPWGDRAVVVGGVVHGAPATDCDVVWGALPGTEREVERVAARWPGPVDRLVGAGATEQAFAAVAPGASLVHVASHGFFSPTTCTGRTIDPMLASGVVLTRDGHDDGLLTAEELIAVDLSAARLVVLSGCGTGTGGIEDGEGVIGLRRALARAGATRVATTLWPVDDLAAVPFVDTFYATWLTGRPSPALALVAAQRAAIAHARRTGSDGWGTWAGYVVTGR